MPRDAYVQLLHRYLHPQAGRVLLLAALLCGGLAVQLANPQVLRFFIDTTQGSGDQRALRLAAGLFLGFALLQHIFGLGANYAGLQVAWTATNRLRRDLALHVLRLDMAFHKGRTPGELIERVDGDVTELASFFSEFGLRVLANGALVVGILALLFAEDVRVGAGLTVYVLLIVLVLAAAQNVATRHWAAARQSNAELFGFVEERITGAEDIRAAGAIPFTLYRLFQHMGENLRHYRLAFLVGAVVQNFTNLLSVAGYAAGLALAVYLYTTGQASIGTAYLVVAYVGMLAAPLNSLREQARNLQQSSASLGRIWEVLSLQPKVTGPAPGAAPVLPAGPLSVSVEGVTFRYDEAEAVLHDVSFCVAPGEVLGVLGRTGSGKTTLTRLLFRLYDPEAGVVRLGGHPAPNVPLPELRARVGLVTQDVQLFHATLRDNLTFFNPNLDDAALEAALRELRLWEWVCALPHGLDTMLKAGGEGLSAGEAQLLAFARVYLKDPGLLILDEASSRLDPATERLLERAIDRLLEGRTGIIIAHRLSTVQRADHLLILENGRVVEFGPRAALAADPASRWNRLLQTGLEAALA